MDSNVVIEAQQKVRQFLTDRMTSGDLSHAYLFVGHEWSGADVLLRWMIEQMKPVEVIALIPRVSKNSSRLAIRIDYVRELKKQLSTSVQGWRIVTLSPTELLEEDAANALLKVLEEPPERTRFLLTATRTDSVLPTILSRCQVMRLAYPSPETVRQELTRQEGRAQELMECLTAPLYSQILASQKLNEQDAVLLEFLLREAMVSAETALARHKAAGWLQGLAAARRAIAYYIPPATAYELIWI